MTDNETETISDRERACMKGHQEARSRLLESPRWDEPDVDELVEAALSYEDFARCVVEELRFDETE